MKSFYYFAIAALLLIACDKVVPEEPSIPEETETDFVFGAVDLGLSVKWANANIGANKSYEYGEYFAWGETEQKDKYDWSTYKFANASYITEYNGTDKTVLDPEDDVAHLRLGGSWRIPTASEIEELVSTKSNENYKWEWKSRNGNLGWLVTCLVNNNSIFLPAAGYWGDTSSHNMDSDCCCWSSSLNADNPNQAMVLYFDCEKISYSICARYYGQSVRPVCD